MIQRFFSGSRAHEKGEVTKESFKESGGGAVVGGTHVASVKRSTRRRMK